MTTWGSTVSSSSGQSFKLGIDASVSGTKVTVSYVFYAAAPMSDTITLTRTGALSGSTNVSITSSGNTTMGSWSFTGQRGKRYSVGGYITGTYNGLSPSVSVSVSIPAAVPSTMSKPTLSSIKSTSLKASWSAPSSNGSSIDKYQIQVDNNSDFGSPLGNPETSSLSRTMDSLPSNTKLYFRVRAHNGTGWGSWSSATSATTLVAAPDAPTNLTLLGSTLSWTNNGGTAIVVERSSGSGYSQILTLGAVSSVSLDPTGRLDNAHYTYRVKATNSTGSSDYSNVVDEYTKAAAPTNVVAAKDANGNIVVTWTDNASYAVQFKIFDNGTQIGTTGALSFTHSTPSTSVTHTYTIQGGESDLSEPSNTVALLAAPNAPALLSPKNGAYFLEGSNVKLEWQHNPTDASPQSMAIVTYDGTSYTASTTDQYTTRLSPALGSHTWTVKTKGLYANYGPSAAVQTFIVAAAPELAVTDPNAGVAIVSLPFTVDEPISSYSAVLYDGEDNILEQLSGITSPATFSTVLKNNTTYRVTLQVTSYTTKLQSAVYEHEWTTNFPLPPLAAVELDFNPETGDVAIDVQVPEPGSEETAMALLEIWRSINGGTYSKLATTEDTSYLFVDHTAVFGGTNTYQVITYSDLKAAITAKVEIVTPEEHNKCYTYISGGADFATICKTKGHKFSDTPDVELESFTFAGRSAPLTMFGATNQRKMTFTSNPHVEGASTAEEWIQLYQARGRILYRDCTGRYIFGVMTDLSMDEEMTVKVTIQESDV